MKLDYKELFNGGYCDCSNCKYKQSDGYEYFGDEDWYCGFLSEEFPVLIDNLEICPLGDKMPIEHLDEEELKEFVIKEMK